jgi:hypothetical protein
MLERRGSDPEIRPNKEPIRGDGRYEGRAHQAMVVSERRPALPTPSPARGTVVARPAQRTASSRSNAALARRKGTLAPDPPARQSFFNHPKDHWTLACR